MGPEIPNSGSGTDAFAEMAASMPSYGDHLANQTGLPPESPPIPAGESNLANEPPNNEQEQTTETVPAAESSPKPATVKTSEAVKDTTESAADFSPEELAGIQKYADELETGAKKIRKWPIYSINSSISLATSIVTAKNPPQPSHLLNPHHPLPPLKIPQNNPRQSQNQLSLMPQLPSLKP